MFTPKPRSKRLLKFLSTSTAANLNRKITPFSLSKIRRKPTVVVVFGERPPSLIARCNSCPSRPHHPPRSTTMRVRGGHPRTPPLQMHLPPRSSNIRRNTEVVLLLRAIPIWQWPVINNRWVPQPCPLYSKAIIRTLCAQLISNNSSSINNSNFRRRLSQLDTAFRLRICRLFQSISL